ncbi:DsrE family protein [Kribbella koreensis]|uniref:DsrE family protein n=3 Tax=Kribbellaceae TaxID=2726069 RepID=A0ABP6Y9Q0_9ACTN
MTCSTIVSLGDGGSGLSYGGVMSRTLVIKLTAGAEEPERANQALTVAATAVASGAQVSLWLTGEAVWFAVPGRAEAFDLPHAAPAADLLAAVLSGGQLTVCTQCAKRRDLTEADLLPNTRIAGAPAFTEEILTDNTQAIVY